MLTLIRRHFSHTIVLFLLAISSPTTHAGEVKSPVLIQDAWARASAPGQSVGAAYLTLTHAKNITLFAIDTEVAETVEIHSMEMKNGVMKMRMLKELPLKAGKPVKLSPGGFHLMLFDLKKPLKVGEKIELTLCFKDQAGEITHQTAILPIKELAH
ncbi:MAG: copper chaperone PCu(A)C [Methylotenera sp.]